MARGMCVDRGQNRYDEINIMEQIGANYGWDIIEGWSCIDQSLELYGPPPTPHPCVACVLANFPLNLTMCLQLPGINERNGQRHSGSE
jgi:hypothetical protein